MYYYPCSTKPFVRDRCMQQTRLDPGGQGYEYVSWRVANAHDWRQRGNLAANTGPQGCVAVNSNHSPRRSLRRRHAAQFGTTRASRVRFALETGVASRHGRNLRRHAGRQPWPPTPFAVARGCLALRRASEVLTSALIRQPARRNSGCGTPTLAAHPSSAQ